MQRAGLPFREPEAGWRTGRIPLKFSKDQHRARQLDHSNSLQRYRERHHKAVGDGHAAVAREPQTIQVLGRKPIAQGLQVRRRRQYILPSPTSDSELVCFQFRKQLQTLTRVAVTSDI